MMKNINKENLNKLQLAVLEIIEEQGDNEEQQRYIQDVLQHGCISGCVSELIYYTDTTKWYDEYIEEISEMLNNTLECYGFNHPQELFTDKWENEDSLILDIYNKNLLAWFSFEETCRMFEG
jgi:hypothetical protein